ncbi:MAG: M23 family metallopeptidase [Bacteroidota bacterium]
MRLCWYCLAWSLLGISLIGWVLFQKLFSNLERTEPLAAICLQEDVLVAETAAIDPLTFVPDAWPVDRRSRISSPFGYRIHPIFKQRRMHRGIDFALRVGTPVMATATGQVEKVMSKPNVSTYGRYVLICHDEEYSSLYAHLSRVLVQEGQLIQKGDTIALSGNSGLSTSPHLHYEVLQHQRRVNPRILWPEEGSALATH